MSDPPRRRLISTGSPFEKQAGYSRAVVSGDFCFVSGTTGYDYATMQMPEAVEDQARNALATIGRTLEEAGFAMEDVVRVQYTLTDAELVDRVFAVLGETFDHGDRRPDQAGNDDRNRGDRAPAVTVAETGILRLAPAGGRR